MIAVAMIVGAVLATMICRLGHELGARNDSVSNAMRIGGGALLFTMAASAASEQLWLGVLAATCSAGFVALGGIDIIRGETVSRHLVVAPLDAEAPVVRDGDTREMPVIMRDVA